MAYTIYWPDAVQKFFKTLPPKDKKLIMKGFGVMESSPRSFGNIIIPLVGKHRGRYRCKQGNWRIIYTISDNEKKIDILDITQREKAY